MDLEQLIGDGDVDFTCPNEECGHQFKVKVKVLMHEGSTVTCPSCKSEITIEHEEGTDKKFRDANRALKDFERTLKNFGK